MVFHHIFSVCWSPVSNDHSVVVANCAHTSERADWVLTCIRITMSLVTLRNSLLLFLQPVRTTHFSLYSIYTSFQVHRSKLLWTIQCSFRSSPVLLPSAISAMKSAQPTMFPWVNLVRKRLPVLVSFLQISRRDLSYLSLQEL
jgi:hypothetical protein